MINIRTINKLNNNDGLTLRKGKPVNYKTGYQVATQGIECYNARDCINAVKAYKGDCGVWYENGIYYVDKSHRVSTKHKAIEEGKQYNQISILRWDNMTLIYLR